MAFVLPATFERPNHQQHQCTWETHGEILAIKLRATGDAAFAIPSASCTETSGESPIDADVAVASDRRNRASDPNKSKQHVGSCRPRSFVGAGQAIATILLYFTEFNRKNGRLQQCP
jgi:hypothetical protein